MTYYSIRANYGFSLVEMAIVLMIVALLLGGLLPTVTSQLEQQHNNATSKQLAEIKEALIGYALINGRLPRPATSATDGAERAAICTGATAISDCAGFIPWATLGISKLDSWGKIIRYSVTPNFANAPFTLSATVATKTIQTRDTGALTYLAGQASCMTTNQCVPAVIFSHGRNNFGTGDSGNALADSSTTNADEGTNNDRTTNNFFSRIHSNNTTASGGEFDDIVVWIPLNTLMSRMVAAGKLP